MKSVNKKWIKRFDDWEESGLKRSEYCRKHKIPLSTFDYWRRRIRKESEPVEKKTGMVKLPITILSEQSTLFILDFPAGIKLRIPEQYDSEILKRIVSDLRESLK